MTLKETDGGTYNPLLIGILTVISGEATCNLPPHFFFWSELDISFSNFPISMK